MLRGMASCTLLRGHKINVKLRRGKVAVQPRSPCKPLPGCSLRRRGGPAVQDRVGCGTPRRLVDVVDAAVASPSSLHQTSPESDGRCAVADDRAVFSKTPDPQEQVHAASPAAPASPPVALTASTAHGAVPGSFGSTVPVATDEELAEKFEAAILRMIDHDIVDQRMTEFHAVRPPRINMPNYLDRIRTLLDCSGACYVLGLTYLRRLLEMHPDIKFSPLSCHRLVSTSLTVAAKFYDDVYHNSMFYAKVVGLKVVDFNALEKVFIRLLDWKLTVSEEEYYKYFELDGATEIRHA